MMIGLMKYGEAMEDIRSVYTYHYYSQYTTSTKKYLQNSLEAFELYKDNLSIINQVAYCYYFLNDYFNALDFVLKAYNLGDIAKRHEEYYYTLKVTGDIYRKLSINESSIYYYMEALKNIGTIDSQQKRCDVLRHMATVYTEIRTLDLATDYAVEALQLAELVHEDKLIGDANLSLCRIYSIRKLHDKALKFGLKGIEVFNTLEDSKGLVLVYLEIASIYEHTNNNMLSKNFYERALMLSNEINYSSGIIFANYLLGKLLFKENYVERAQFILEEALALSRKYNIQKHKADIYYTLSELYAKCGDFELAYNSYKTGTELKEHLTSDRNKEKIYKLQNEYNLYIKEKELKQYMEQNQSLEKINRQLSEEVQLDALTNLLNRRGLKRSVNNLSFEGSHMIILGDIDNFKLINDEYGHPCGDALLKELSLLFKNNLKSNYRVARWGGEEFLMVLPSTTQDLAIAFAEEILFKISNMEFTYQGSKFTITMTFGVAPLLGDFETSIHLADQRLYKGKKNGKNQVVFD